MKDLGHVDIENVHKVYRACTDFAVLAGLPFSFLEDTGHKETMIRIWEDGRYVKPVVETGSRVDPETWSLISSRFFVPDVMDFKNQIIVEFEETYTKNKKGHDPDGQDLRTSWRDLYYATAKFRLLKIFDYEFKDETAWRIKLFRFLTDCYQNKVEVAA